MKKLLLSAAVLAISAGAALAADLPSRKGPPVLPPPPPPPPLWTGFYAGLNAGYGFGTNSNTQSIGLASDAVGFGGINITKQPKLEIADLSPARLMRVDIDPYFVSSPTGAGLALSNYGPNTQSGFIGGGQIGYNYQWGPNFVIGLEADMQGTGIRGSSHGAGVGGSSTTSPLFVLTKPSEDVNLAALDERSRINLRDLGINNSANSIGATTVNAGVDWLGTVRGRLGYLFTPTMLVYATGGLTYGGVYANVNQWANTNLQISLVNTKTNDTLLGPLGTNHTFIGGGNKSQVLVGWNVGGGIEWMFMPNWSIKAEGIYWNMGNMNVPTATFAAAPITGINTPLSVTNPMTTIGATRVNYQGVIARMGINYHFNWFAPAPVVAKY